MKVSSWCFLPPLWGLLPLHETIPPASHHVIAPTAYVQHRMQVPLPKTDDIIQIMTDPKDELSLLFNDEKVNVENVFRVDRQRLFNAIDGRHVLPLFHSFTPFHYIRYVDSIYGHTMSYTDFCLLEEKVADIVISYVKDPLKHHTLLLDPIFLYSDSIKSYGDSTTFLHTVWVAFSTDMGTPDFILWKIPNDQQIL